MTGTVLPQSGEVETFLGLAERGEWEEFDRSVLMVCNDPNWLNWTNRGLRNPVTNVRDLAISILEKTDTELTQIKKLN